MEPVVTSSIISALGSGIGNLVGSSLERRSQRRQQELARRQSLEDRSHNEWYNSPAQQRERLRQAGLGVSSDTVKPDDTSSENMQYAEPFTNDILNSRSTGLSQLAAAPAEAMKFALDMAEQTSRIKGLSTDNDLKDITLRYADENARLVLDKGYNELQQGIERLDEIRSSANLTKKQEKSLDIQIEYGRRLADAKTKIAELDAAIASNRKKISDETVDVEIRRQFAELEQAFQSIRFSQSQISKICAEISNLNADTANSATMGRILSENLTQEQLKSEYDKRSLEDRLSILSSEEFTAESRSNIASAEAQKAIIDESTYAMDKALGGITSLVGMGVSTYNAGTHRMIGKSISKPKTRNVAVDSYGSPIVLD